MRHLLIGSILLASIAVAAAALAGDVAKARQELASTGKLRVGVVSAPKADAFFVVKNADDRPRGVTVDLGDELARTLKRKDRELDGLTDSVNERLVERATLDSELVPSYVDLIFVARAIERIGDHSTNIAEDSFWRDRAADIRHTWGPKEQC